MKTRRLSFLVYAVAILAGGCGSSDNPGVDGGGGADSAAPGAEGGGGTPCGIAENEPNNTRDNPTAYTAGSAVVACVGSDTDIDFYELTSPAGDLAGGYYLGGLTSVGAEGMLEVKVYTASDNSTIVENVYTVDKGGSLFFHWPGAPGQKYRIAVSNFVAAGKPFKYTLTASYTKVNDTFEPNDTAETAKPLTLGTQVSGYIFTGFKAKEIAAKEYEDWFSFSLVPGMVTIKLEKVATNIAGQVKLLDSTGTEVNLPTPYNATMGGSVITMGMITTGGAYKLGVSTFFPPGNVAGKGMSATDAPDSFSRAYGLTVSQ